MVSRALSSSSALVFCVCVLVFCACLFWVCVSVCFVCVRACFLSVCAFLFSVCTYGVCVCARFLYLCVCLGPIVVQNVIFPVRAEMFRGVEKVVCEVEAIKGVKCALTGLCAEGSLASPDRKVLKEALVTIGSINKNLISALPSNQRVACRHPPGRKSPSRILVAN